MFNLNVGSKRKNHKKGIAARHKDNLRVQAETRQAEYNKLTISEKIAKLDKYGYKATKQRAKLNYDITLKSVADRLRKPS